MRPSDTLLVDRGVYTIQSRNLVVVVYDAERDTMIGIREKFGTTFLAKEVVNRPPEKLGTVTAILGGVGTVPDDLELVEGFLTLENGYRRNEALYDFLLPLTEDELGYQLDTSNEER